MISNSELTGDMVLNIERENGLYMTTEKAIRKAFNKSTDLATPIQVGSRQPIKIGLATPIQVGSHQPTKIGYGNNRKSSKLTSNASYFTAKLSDVEELVRFWHINLGHMSKQKMITTVENNNIDGLAEMVYVQQINKYFPDCPDCVHANLAQKSHPKLSDRVYEIGNE